MGEILRVDRNERMRGRLQINGNLRKKTGVTDVFLQENLEMSKICSLNVSFREQISKVGFFLFLCTAEQFHHSKWKQI